MNNITKYKWFILIISLLSMFSCNQNEEPLVYDAELVFPNSFKIKVEPYSYYNSDSSEVYKVLGDSAIVPDTVSSTPTFKWTNVLSGLVTVVISEDLFVVRDNEIINADKIIWQWQPGLENGKHGEVPYLEGKMVDNKNILSHTQPLPLQNGLYYWAVYGWESSGREIIYSTKPLLIYVK